MPHALSHLFPFLQGRGWISGKPLHWGFTGQMFQMETDPVGPAGTALLKGLSCLEQSFDSNSTGKNIMGKQKWFLKIV